MTLLDTPPASDRTVPDAPLELVSDVDVLSSTLDVLDVVVDECRLRWHKDGIHVAAVDPATVAMVDLNLSVDAFESYVTPEDDRTIGVDLERLGEALALADGDRPVRFAAHPDRGMLRLESGDLEYTIGLLDPDVVRTPPSIDDFDLGEISTATVGTTGRTVGEAIRAAETVSDHLEVGVTRGTAGADPAFYAAAAGDTDEMVLTISPDDLRELSIDVEGHGDNHDDATTPIRSLFSVSYLRAFDRALPRDVDVDVQLASEAPIEVRFAFADGAGTVRYLLSPRIRRE